jgi:hypothetical protein
MIIVVVALFIVIGCSNNLYQSPEANSEQNEDSVADPSTELPSSVSDYQIYEEEYTAYNKENNPFKVKYAQISGLGNENLENKINQTLKLSITEWINEDCEWADKLQVDVKYKTSKYLIRQITSCYSI